MSSNPRIPYQMTSDRPRLPPPVPGKPLIVHVVVNVEYWPFDQPPPRKLIPGPHGTDHIPEVPNLSSVEYGMRTQIGRASRSDRAYQSVYISFGAAPSTKKYN